MMTEKKYSFERAEPHLKQVADECIAVGHRATIVDVHPDLISDGFDDRHCGIQIFGHVCLLLSRSERAGKFKRGTVMIYHGHNGHNPVPELSAHWMIDVVGQREEEFGFFTRFTSWNNIVGLSEFEDWCSSRNLNKEIIDNAREYGSSWHEFPIIDPNLLFEFKMRWL